MDLSWVERVVQHEDWSEDGIEDFLWSLTEDEPLERLLGGLSAPSNQAHPHAHVRAFPAALAHWVVGSAASEVEGGHSSFDVLDDLQAIVAALPDLPTALVNSLGDPAPLVRRWSVLALGALTHHEHPRVSRALQPWPAVDPARWRSARGDGDPTVRAAAWRSMKAEPDPEATKRALEDGDVRVQAAAVPWVHVDSDEALRRRVVTLAQGEGPQADAALQHLVRWQTAEGTDALVARLRRGPDAFALQWAGDGAWSAVPAKLLLSGLGADRPQEEARLAARALTAWCDASCGPALLESLQGPDPVAIQAAIALCRGAPAGSEPILEAILSLPNVSRDIMRQTLRNAAARALGAMGTAAAYKALLTCQVRPFKGKSPAPDAAVVCGALGMVERRAAAARIRTIAADNVYAQRVWSVALGQCGDPAMEGLLEPLLASKDRHVPALTALGLQLLRPEREDMVARLREPAPCRAASFEALALAALGGLRSLGRGGDVYAPARAACLDWARAMGPALDEMVDCYRGRGRMTGYSMSYVWWLRDLHREALEGLRRRG